MKDYTAAFSQTPTPVKERWEHYRDWFLVSDKSLGEGLVVLDRQYEEDPEDFLEGNWVPDEIFTLKNHLVAKFAGKYEDEDIRLSVLTRNGPKDVSLKRIEDDFVVSVDGETKKIKSNTEEDAVFEAVLCVLEKEYAEKEKWQGQYLRDFISDEVREIFKKYDPWIVMVTFIPDEIREVNGHKVSINRLPPRPDFGEEEKEKYAVHVLTEGGPKYTELKRRGEDLILFELGKGEGTEIKSLGPDLEKAIEGTVKWEVDQERSKEISAERRESTR